ncbi:hypothetical protein RBB50_012870 [Rhinocladiella similis]
MEDFEPSEIDDYPVGSPHDAELIAADVESKDFRGLLRKKHKPGKSTWRMIRVTEAHAIWIKGTHFPIANLIMESALARTWADGSVASFRLCPQDYHRFHSPVNGIVKWWKHIPGDYYNVDPIALRSRVDILSQNARSCLCISSPEFGYVLFVAIGATGVATIKFHENICGEGSRVVKGEELGWFEFGGSSILVVFESGRIHFDSDLIEASEHVITVNVEVGMKRGSATQ